MSMNRSVRACWGLHIAGSDDNPIGRRGRGYAPALFSMGLFCVKLGDPASIFVLDPGCCVLVHSPAMDGANAREIQVVC